MTGRRVRRRAREEVTRRRCCRPIRTYGPTGQTTAWQIGRFELTCSLALTLTAGQAAVNYFVNFLINSVHNWPLQHAPVSKRGIVGHPCRVCVIFNLTVMVAVLLLYFVRCAFDDNNIQVFLSRFGFNTL